ncbi:hypothetical protein Tco_0640953, partial [Tanacetum coccineum]
NMPRILIPLRPILGVLQIGIRAAESRLSETETVSGGTKDSEEPPDSDDRASKIAGTC